MSIVDGGPASTGLISRIRNILLQPNAEWDVIAAEPATVKGLYTGYAMILAAIPVIATFIGGFFAFGLISSQVSSGGVSGMVGSASALTAAVAILVPIVIFWFLALLVWRAQELRLMASAMTEVAVRLAEPDRLAEQSVASVGQTIRRQVAARSEGAMLRRMGKRRSPSVRYGRTVSSSASSKAPPVEESQISPTALPARCCASTSRQTAPA